MKIAVVFTLDVPDGTDPQRVLDVVNRELDSAADGGGLVQYGDWGYTPALLAWATGPGGRMPDECEYCGASGNGGHGGGCPNGSGGLDGQPGGSGYAAGGLVVSPVNTITRTIGRAGASADQAGISPQVVVTSVGDPPGTTGSGGSADTMRYQPG